MNGLCRLFCCGGKVTPPEHNSLTLNKSSLVLEEEQIRYLLLGFSLARLGETDGVAAGGGGGAAGPGGGGGVGRRRRHATCAHGRRYPTGEQIHRHPGIWGRGLSRSQDEESFQTTTTKVTSPLMFKHEKSTFFLRLIVIFIILRHFQDVYTLN